MTLVSWTWKETTDILNFLSLWRIFNLLNTAQRSHFWIVPLPQSFKKNSTGRKKTRNTYGEKYLRFIKKKKENNLCSETRFCSLKSLRKCPDDSTSWISSYREFIILNGLAPWQCPISSDTTPVYVIFALKTSCALLFSKFTEHFRTSGPLYRLFLPHVLYKWTNWMCVICWQRAINNISSGH